MRVSSGLTRVLQSEGVNYPQIGRALVSRANPHSPFKCGVPPKSTYNNRRRRRRLGKLTPVEFEPAFAAANAA